MRAEQGQQAIWDRLLGKVLSKGRKVGADMGTGREARARRPGEGLEITTEPEHGQEALSFCTEASICQSFP